VAAENDISLRGRCSELETIIVDLQRQLDIEVSQNASRLAEQVAASQHAAVQAQQHTSQLMADIDDLRAQLKVCRLCSDFCLFV